MDIALLPQHWASILCICIMIGAIVFSYVKKFMLTYTLITANIIIFVITWIYFLEIIYGIENDIQAYAGLGFRSMYLSVEYSPQMYTLFTSMFIHGGLAHLFGNMLFFFFIGLPFEQRIGWKKFFIIYIITGICAALTHSMLNLGSSIPLIGASGAIFGIMGAFAFSYPRDEVVMPIGIGIMFLTRIKVMYAVIFFAAIETFIVWIDVPDGTAHFAHLGGLISGFILAALLLRKQKTHTKEGKTVYYDSYKPVKISKEDYSELKKLATTPELKKMYNKIENEDVPQVRDTWLEHFLEKTVCPKCKKPLHSVDNNVWCEYCGFRTKI